MLGTAARPCLVSFAPFLASSSSLSHSHSLETPSKCPFFQSQGLAYEDIPEGTYYPTASLFTLPGQAPPAKVRLNFGPAFTHPPAVAGPAVEAGWCGVRGGDRERLPRPRPASEMAEVPEGARGGGAGGGGGK